MDSDKLEGGNMPEAEVKGATAGILAKLTSSGNVEERGIVPVPLEERTNRRTYSIVFLWKKSLGQHALTRGSSHYGSR